MSIKTDSKSIEDKKDPDECNVYNIYKLIAHPEDASSMREKYQKGNFGYGHAKEALFDLICKLYKNEREKFTHLMCNQELIEKELIIGSRKARIIAKDVLSRVRKNIGY